MMPEDYFNNQQLVVKKKYDALYKFFKDKLPASQVAEMYGYTKVSFYSLIRDFRKHLKEHPTEDFFFKEVVMGRKPNKNDELKELIIKLRKKNFSVENTAYFTQYKYCQRSQLAFLRNLLPVCVPDALR